MMGRPQKRGRLAPVPTRPAAVSDLQPGRRRLYNRLALAGAFVLIVAALTRPPARNELSIDDFNTNAVALEEIRAAFRFESVDLAATAAAKTQTAERAPYYYRVSRDRVETQLTHWKEWTARIAAQRPAISSAIVNALRAAPSGSDRDALARETLKTILDSATPAPGKDGMPELSILELWLTPDIQGLPEQLAPGDDTRLTFSLGDTLERLGTEALETILAEGVRPEKLAPEEQSRHVVILREIPGEPSQPSEEKVLEDIPYPKRAIEEPLNEILTDLAKKTVKIQAAGVEWARMHDAVLPVIAPLVVDTLEYDKVDTEAARARAVENIPPLMKEVKAGEIIQDRGKRWTAQSLSDVQAYIELLDADRQPGQRIVRTIASHILLTALVLACMMRAIGVLQTSAPITADTRFNLALLMLCTCAVLGRVVSYFEPTGYVIPLAAATVLYAILATVPLAALLGTMASVLISAQYNYDWRLLVAHTAMSLAGAFSIYKVRRRGDMAAASLTAAIFGILAAASLLLASETLLSAQAWRRMALIALNGGICLMAVPALLPPLERLFNITTDIQLLEYSDLNNEILSRLAIEAPATYAHSLMLGQLAEAAADAIGANGLLARVCAYYHDIGKIMRSEYFTENQSGYNVHDDLSPRMSARAIAAHVSQGAELAREYRLPKPIIDAIYEHHGTCRIGRFYEAALEQQKHGDVREEDFRYPGPRPQRPETAILMICDAIESGVRSIKNPTEDRVREFIDKIIAQRQAGRQFDECDLTFRQLDTIAKVIAKRMTTSMHTRIAYPDLKDKQPEEPNTQPPISKPPKDQDA